MASAIEQSRLNLKNVVRSMSASEISSLTNVFSKQIGVDIEKSVKVISPKCIMVTISMEKEKISGYGRSEEEASLNAFKNFMEGMIDKDDMVHPLSSSLSKLKEGHSRSRKPPKGRNDMGANNSFMHTSMDKGASLCDRIKGLNLQSDANKSRQNESTDGHEQGNRQKSRAFLGRSFMETDADRSRIEGHTSSMQAGKSRTPDRTLYIHETHDCLYR